MKVNLMEGRALLEFIESYYKGEVIVVGLWKLTDLSFKISQYGVVDYITKKSLDCLDLNHAIYIYNICVERYQISKRRILS